MGDIETRNPFEIFKALESFQPPDERTVRALRAFGESLVEAAQAVVTAMQPMIEAMNAWWYSLPADLRRAILASSRPGGVSHTRYAMRARKIGRVITIAK